MIASCSWCGAEGGVLWTIALLAIFLGALLYGIWTERR